MAGPLTANPDPLHFDAGPFGNIYTTGVLSGWSQWQDNVVPGDHSAQVDLSNGQVFVQKPDGLVQFFIHAGIYSQPSLGVPYSNAIKTTNDFWGPVPEAFLTLALTDELSIMGGKLPSLPGLESTFTFENMNIDRGLLWNQTYSIARGVQVNYSHGPMSLIMSWNDGYYSNRLTWLFGSAAWKFDDADQLILMGTGNTAATSYTSSATPLLQNNSQIYDAIYTHATGRWTLSPYLQYTFVPQHSSLGIPHDLATYGAAILGYYAFDSGSGVLGLSLRGFSLPCRLEYIASSGSIAGAGLLYGPGSSAWSLTITPTYQYERFFARAEFSYVGADQITTGSAFGADRSKTNQTRLLLEWGLLL